MPRAWRSWLAVEVGERARLRQHEVGDVALAGHDLLDPLVDGAGAHQAVADHGVGLADAPRAVAGLVLDGGVPPAVVEHDVVGGGEVEPGAAGLERQHERARARRRPGTRSIIGRARAATARRGSTRPACRCVSVRWSASRMPHSAKWVNTRTRSSAANTASTISSRRRELARSARERPVVVPGRPRGGCRSA